MESHGAVESGAGAERLSPRLSVADSKLVSHETVEDLDDAQIRFVSRLPNTFGVERTTKSAAAQANAWITVRVLSDRHGSATYQVWEALGRLGGREVRLMVVHSSALETKAPAQETVRVERDATRGIARSAKGTGGGRVRTQRTGRRGERRRGSNMRYGL